MCVDQMSVGQIVFDQMTLSHQAVISGLFYNDCLMFQVGPAKTGTLCLGNESTSKPARSIKKFATLSTRPGRF